MIDAVAREGGGSTGSRLLRGDRDSFADVERRFAAFKGAERALYFSSGYLANLAVLTTFPSRATSIFSDELNHASLIDGVRLSRARPRRVSAQRRRRARARCIARDAPPRTAGRFVVVESLFSMDGDVAPLAANTRRCAATPAPRSSSTKRTPSASTARAAAG